MQHHIYIAYGQAEKSSDLYWQGNTMEFWREINRFNSKQSIDVPVINGNSTPISIANVFKNAAALHSDFVSNDAIHSVCDILNLVCAIRPCHFLIKRCLFGLSSA